MSTLNMGNVARIAAVMGQLSQSNAIRSNFRQRQIADRNIAAGQAQLDLQESAVRSRMARELAAHQGSLAANAAFRGTHGAGTEEAATRSAGLVASSELAFTRANKAAEEAALVASQQFVPEDPTAAAMRGALEGIAMGSELESLLLSATQTTTRKTNLDDDGIRGFREREIAITPGFSPGDILGDLF